MSQALDRFSEMQKTLQQYELAVSMLHWDLQTASPKKGMDDKTQALGFFSTEAFKITTSDEYGEILKALSEPEEFDQLSLPMQITVKRYLEDYTRYKRIPQDFYTEFVTAGAKSSKAWKEAKKDNNFSHFEPWLDKLITMKTQYVKFQEPDAEPYEFLLDRYEKGMDSATIEKLFTELKAGLIPLLAKINAAEKPDLSALEGKYDVDAQRKVQKLLLEYIGFDFEAGTVGETEHPFTTQLGHGDVRVTNHFYEDNPLHPIFSAIHEGGHGIYDQNVDPAYQNTALEELHQMGLHESQSRFYENILGRNKNFWLPIYDQVAELLPQLKNVPLDTFWRAVNDVHPSFIRTEADEVTYCLHIILRFEMEKAIFKDHVPTAKLPALWNQKFEEMFGICPPTDTEGILQDTHWADAYYGYFPSYLLGSIYDGMFLVALEKDLGSVDTILAEGRIKEITAWLNEKIHRHGSLYTSAEIIQRVCGCDISAQPLLDYFNKKYSEIYGF